MAPAAPDPPCPPASVPPPAGAVVSPGPVGAVVSAVSPWDRAFAALGGVPAVTPSARSMSSIRETASSLDRSSWPVTASRRRLGRESVWIGVA